MKLLPSRYNSCNVLMFHNWAEIVPDKERSTRLRYLSDEGSACSRQYSTNSILNIDRHRSCDQLGSCDTKVLEASQLSCA